MRIAVSTSGGDAPGLNPLIRGVVTSALQHGHRVFGIRNGFSGLIDNDALIELAAKDVEGIERQGARFLAQPAAARPSSVPAGQSRISPQH